MVLLFKLFHNLNTSSRDALLCDLGDKYYDAMLRLSERSTPHGRYDISYIDDDYPECRLLAIDSTSIVGTLSSLSFDGEWRRDELTMRSTLIGDLFCEVAASAELYLFAQSHEESSILNASSPDHIHRIALEESIAIVPLEELTPSHDHRTLVVSNLF